MNCLSCQETLDLGPSISRAKPSIHVSVWMRVLTPQIAPQPLPGLGWGGVLLLAVCAGGRPSPRPRRPQMSSLDGWEEAFSP